jgi:phage terminase large subunit
VAYGQTTHVIDIPDTLVPVFEGVARYRCAFGGRGSGKTRTFAKMAAVHGARAALSGQTGVVVCGRQFMNSLADSSFAEIKASIEGDEWLNGQYEIGETFIRTRCRRVEFLFVGLARNLSSIKSKARILLCWIDEAEDVSEEAWVTLIPTVREDGSEIWVTWNPKRKGSPTDKRFRHANDNDVRSAEINWKDNPWFPQVLEAERQRDLRDRPDQYDHIWGGGYATAAVGAYYAKQLLVAKAQGRIKPIIYDPLMAVRTHHDIGGRGARADAYSIWVSQWIGPEILVLDHYAAVGQPLSTHANWLRQRGYGEAEIVLPHDGDNQGGPVHSWADGWRAAKLGSVKVIPNQGEGAAMYRIEQARRWFPRVIFDAVNTEEGRVSLGMYAPKISKETGADLGPNHDVYSHDADAFGLMMCDYKPPTNEIVGKLSPRVGTHA